MMEENAQESVNHWKIDKFNPGDMKSSLTEDSSFLTLFPKYREKYLKQKWSEISQFLMSQYGIEAILNVKQGSMEVKTTPKTWDPFSIIKARDLLRLLSRSVNFEQAQRIMKDDIYCDIINIDGFTRSKEKFAKRRQRLIGPNGATLKALELLTNTYLMVQGKTVVCMGGFKDLKLIRSIVEDCMKNIHPIYHVKSLMIRKELAKDPQLKEENWERFLPKFKKKSVKRKKKTSKKKQYTPFPPEQTPRKMDVQLETGEYFLSDTQKKSKAKREQEEKQKEVSQVKRKEKEQVYIPPKEKKKPTTNPLPSTEELTTKLKENIKKRKHDETATKSPATEYILSPGKKKKITTK